MKYQEHLNNGCNGNKAKAIQEIKKDFKLGYGEAKIFIIEERRLMKLNNDCPRKNQQRPAPAQVPCGLASVDQSEQ